MAGQRAHLRETGRVCAGSICPVSYTHLIFMQELKERGAQIFTNPYVIQVDKFAGSLKKLSDTFSKLEDYRATFTNEENDDIFERVTQKVCRECENREKCLGERRQQTYHMRCV